ncbi:hypothetical protein ACOACQ_01605 [Nocardioides sp. CPCC 206347]|uniref:hypothetical protein n=1 Tax=unclassified Nocardioides TaxID=2615069 RepID=UPI0036212E36
MSSRRMFSGLAPLGLASVIIFGLTSLNAPRTTDVVSADVAAWQLATTGSPWLDDVEDDDLPGTWTVESLFTTTNADNGHEVVARSPGPIAAAVPAYAVEYLISAGASSTKMSFLPAGFTAALLATCALMLLAGSLPTSVPRHVTLTAAAALAFTTPYWTVVGGSLWTHTVTAVGIGGMAWAAHRDRWLLVGLFGGVAVLGRLHLALTVAIVGLSVAATRRQPGIALRVGAASAPAIAVLSLWGHWFYGSWSPTTGYAAGDLAAWPATRTWWEQLGDLLGMLISPGYGIFVWTPVLLILIPSVIRGWREVPDWARALAIGGFFYLLIQVYLNPYHGGNGFWGYRLPLESLCCAFPLLAMSLAHLGERSRALLTPLLGFQLGTMALGAVLGLGLLQKDAAWGWRHYTLASAAGTSVAAVALFLLIGMTTAYLVRSRLVGIETPSGAESSSRSPT